MSKYDLVFDYKFFIDRYIYCNVCSGRKRKETIKSKYIFKLFTDVIVLHQGIESIFEYKWQMPIVVE